MGIKEILDATDGRKNRTERVTRAAYEKIIARIEELAAQAAAHAPDGGRLDRKEHYEALAERLRKEFLP